MKRMYKVEFLNQYGWQVALGNETISFSKREALNWAKFIRGFTKKPLRIVSWDLSNRRIIKAYDQESEEAK